MSSSDAALWQEIERLKGAIHRHKNATAKPQSSSKSYRPYPPPTFAHKKYVNPALSSSNLQSRSGASVSASDDIAPSSSHQVVNVKPREVVIDGVAFQSSQRKLTRVDLKKSTTESPASATSKTPSARTYVRKGSKFTGPNAAPKPKYRKRKALGGRNNLVLDNVKGTRTGKLPKAKRQCRFFTMTGECQRGLTCPYQHDPEKIAICPLFLSHSCPNTAENCRLSHDPTPSRVPLCHHFCNYGRCTRENCPYPHIRVGPRSGVCRDFAVVGYCDKGIDCDKQHVRECPDFAEKGSCPNKSCKLPHVIRANMRRRLATTTALKQDSSVGVSVTGSELRDGDSKGMDEPPSKLPTGNPGTAEEFISLTFEESEDEVSEDESDEDSGGEASEAEGEDVDI